MTWSIHFNFQSDFVCGSLQAKCREKCEGGCRAEAYELTLCHENWSQKPNTEYGTLTSQDASVNWFTLSPLVFPNRWCKSRQTNAGVHLIYAATPNVKTNVHGSVVNVSGVLVLRGNLHGQALEFCGSSSAVKRGLEDYKTQQHWTI